MIHSSKISIESATVLHQPVLRGLELAYSMLEMDGPFTNVTKGKLQLPSQDPSSLSSGQTVSRKPTTGELGYDRLNWTRKIGLSYAKSVVYTGKN